MDIERVISVGLVSHHLITFAREAAAGRQNAGYYSQKVSAKAASAAPAIAEAA
jgi:hypothetical protein